MDRDRTDVGMKGPVWRERKKEDGERESRLERKLQNRSMKAENIV